MLAEFHRHDTSLAFALFIRSIVDTEVLRYLYDEARADIEYKSSDFWQHYLKQEFNDVRTYTVTCEVSPDGSRRRVDIVVKRFDVNHRTMTALLWVECKRPGGSIREVEAQALDAAKRCVKADNNLFIYTMTTVGVSFRLWFYEKGGASLIPFRGEPTTADWSQYIDADSDPARVLPRCIQMVKSEIPLKDAPTVPSQSLSDLQPAHETQEGLDDQVPGIQGEYYAGEPSSTAQLYQQPWQPVDGGTARSADDHNDQVVPVKVRREEHTFQPDRYLFKDAKGRTRITVNKDWTQIKYNGTKVWAYCRKKTTYISDVEIK